MVTDMPIDLWLDTQQHHERRAIVPYVRSAEPATVQYRIALVRESTAGSSRIQQSGQVVLVAGEATALTTLSTAGQAADSCHIAITLSSANHPATRYQFDCTD